MPRKPQSSEDSESEDRQSLEAKRRRQLLDAVIEAVAEVGLEKTTMRVVADRAGVTTGMLLYYYKNRQDLIHAAIALAAEEFTDSLDAITDSMFGPERLRALAEVWLREDIPGRVPRNFALHYRAAALYDSDIRRAYQDIYQQARGQLIRSVQSGKRAGTLRQDLDDELTADYIHALLQGLAIEVSLNPHVMSSQRAIDAAGLGLFFLLEKPDAAHIHLPQPAPATASVSGQLESAIGNDPELAPAVRTKLAASINLLYQIALEASKAAQ